MIPRLQFWSNALWRLAEVGGVRVPVVYEGPYPILRQSRSVSGTRAVFGHRIDDWVDLRFC